MRRNSLFGIMTVILVALASAALACSLPFLSNPTPTLTATVTAPPTLEVTTPAPTPSPEVGTTVVAAVTTTGTSECGYNAGYVSDITIPDGTVFNPGATFVKTWRMSNIGCQDWSSGTMFMFVQGDLMGGPTGGVPVALTAPTGQQDISVTLVAPAVTGHYRGYWQFKAPNGVFFGPKVFVDIVVANPGVTPPPGATPTSVPGFTLIPPLWTFSLPIFPLLPTATPTWDFSFPAFPTLGFSWP